MQECSTVPYSFTGTCGRETLPYHTVTRWATMKFPVTVRFRTRQAIKAVVDQSVRRLVQEDAVVGIRRLPDVWRRVLHVGGDYF